MANIRKRIKSDFNKFNEEKCKHSSVAYTEVLKHTIVKTHHPISNSRVQAINDLEVAKVEEIKVPAYKCLECGEIIEIKEFGNTQKEPTYGYSSNKGNELTGYYSTAIGYNSTAIGGYSSSGQNNIAIGAGAKSNIAMSATTYAGDYEKNYSTRTDMGFLDDMSEALKNVENKQEKAMKNYESKQLKLDRIAEKVRALRGNTSSVGGLFSEIDKIKAEYNQIVNKQQVAQQQAQQQFRSGSKLNSPPPPPPKPQGRKVGVYDAGSDMGYYNTDKPTAVQPNKKNDSNINGIEYMKIMFRGLQVEEKTFKDVKYVDFTFPYPIDQEDSKLNILEKGDVIEWVKVGKNKKLGILSPKVKAIKAIRISLEDLNEARKAQTNEG